MSTNTSPSSVPVGPELRAALVAMVRKRVPESEVEDIVQSTLADALESPHAPPDAESFRRWIFGVAKNKVVDYHRRAGRETFDMPEVAGRAAPHTEADLLRWAEKNLPPGEENKTTLDWMLREGDGEKLEWIAEDARVPAPRVRQRVSRLRRHLKTHWQKEVAVLAALGVMLTVLVLVLRKRDPEPIANEDAPRAVEMRRQGLEKCAASEWKECLDKLDEAKRLDPAGDTRPEVKSARESAREKIKAPLAPSSNLTPPPIPEPVPAPAPGPTASSESKFKTMPMKGESTASPPIPTVIPTVRKPNPAPKSSGLSDSSISPPYNESDGIGLGSSGGIDLGGGSSGGWSGSKAGGAKAARPMPAKAPAAKQRGSISK